jgi:hypothetical protein
MNRVRLIIVCFAILAVAIRYANMDKSVDFIVE